jgi:hypothetical protein
MTTQLRLISRTPMATLAGHISDIVRVGAKEQVIGPDTTRIVAAVTDFHPLGNWSVMQFPREPMGGDGCVLPATQLAIAIRGTCRCPLPARLTLADLRPEALLCRYVRSSRVQRIAMPSPALVVHDAVAMLEVGSTTAINRTKTGWGRLMGHLGLPSRVWGAVPRPFVAARGFCMPIIPNTYSAGGQL